MNDNTADQERRAYTDGLRGLADWLDANSDIPLPWTGADHLYAPFQLGVWVTKEELATIIKALPGKVDKDYGDQVVRVNASFGGLKVQAYSGRNEVCERVVVGTEQVTIPATEAVEAQAEHVEEREVVEWRCHPILGQSSADDVEQVSA